MPPTSPAAAGYLRRFRALFRIFIGCALAFGLTGCNDGAIGYFPLEKGVTWVYRQTVITRNKGNAGGLEKSRFAAAATNLAPRMVGDRKAVPQLYADGRALYFARVDDGIVLIGTTATDEDTADRIAPRYVLKLPLAVGATWTSDGETEVMRRTFLSGYGAVSKPVDANGSLVFTVESLDDTVRVPAGTFRHCLRVHGIGSAKLAWGEPFGVLTINLEVTRWYASGIGLVKRVRKEDTGADGPLGAELDEELKAVSKHGWLG